MNDYLSIDPLNENIRACRAYTRHHAKSFYFSSHVLPRGKRDAAYAVYAFCRYVDNIVDTAPATGGVGTRADALAELRAQLDHVYTHDRRMHPRLIGLLHAVDTYHIPRMFFDDLITGVEMDRVKTRHATFAELDTYCWHVASVVGLIMTHIFGVSDPAAFTHAADLGTAMQLTNILRDVGEDLRLGRVYLPQDELARFGIDESALAHGVVDDRWRAFMRFQIARAREYFRRADDGIALLTDDGSRFCVRLMRETYAGILDAIERNDFDVFTQRAHVPASRKLAIALQQLMTHGFRSRAADLIARVSDPSASGVLRHAIRQPAVTERIEAHAHDAIAHDTIVHGAGVHGAGAHGAGVHGAGAHSAGVHSAGVHSAGVHSAGAHGAGVHSAGVHGAGVHRSPVLGTSFSRDIL